MIKQLQMQTDQMLVPHTIHFYIFKILLCIFSYYKCTQTFYKKANQSTLYVTAIDLHSS